jgi:hypothetical protein
MPADPQQFEATLREVQRDRERYTAWLQLPPPEELPEPTCYDLLGLTPATANAARARQSCTERTKTVRSYQGVYPTEVQRVRSHLEQAARILSERADRAAYDRWLSERAEAVRQERVEQLAGYVDVAVDQENTVTVTRQDRLRAQARKLGLTPADADALLTARSVRVVPDRPVRAQLEEALDLVVVDGAVTETHRDKLRSQAGKIGLTEADADAVLKARSVHVVPDRRRRRAKPVPTPASRPTRKEVSPVVAALVIIMVMVIISATYLLLGRSKKTAATDPESTKTQVSKSAPPTPAPAARQPTSQPANQARPPANAKKGDTWTNPIDGAVMVFVPAREFTMGSTEADSEADDDEKPQRRVYLDAYWIDQTEVTNEQYGKFLARILQSKDHSKCHPDEPENKDHTPSGSS